MAGRHDAFKRVSNILARLELESHRPIRDAMQLRDDVPALRKGAIALAVALMRSPATRRAVPYIVIGGVPEGVEEHIGQGTEQAVFRSTDHRVKKIMMGAATRSEERAIDLANEQQAKVNTVAEYLGQYCLPTIYSPVRISFLGQSLWTIASTQSDISHTTPIYHNRVANLEAISQIRPIEQIEDFWDRSNKLYVNEGLIVDILGDGNLVVDSNPSLGHGELLLADTVPRTPEEGSKPTRTYGRTLGDDLLEQLDHFRSFAS